MEALYRPFWYLTFVCSLPHPLFCSSFWTGLSLRHLPLALVFGDVKILHDRGLKLMLVTVAGSSLRLFRSLLFQFKSCSPGRQEKASFHGRHLGAPPTKIRPLVFLSRRRLPPSHRMQCLHLSLFFLQNHWQCHFFGPSGRVLS